MIFQSPVRDKLYIELIMRILIFGLILIFSAGYLFVWTTNKAQPFRKDGTKRNILFESLSVAIKLTCVTVIIAAGYFIWEYYDESQSKKIIADNITAKWRSDEIILKINKDSTFQYDAYAGAEKGKNWKGSWKLDGGVLFLNFGDNTSTNNYRIVSLDKDNLELELKVKDVKGNDHESNILFDKVE